MRAKPVILVGIATLLAAATGLSANPSRHRPGEAQPSRGDRDRIEWPNEQYPTLQDAIYGLRPGGHLQIREGQYEIRQPLIVRERITIEGAGCGEDLPQGRGRHRRATQLVGPRPERVVGFGEIAGLLTYSDSGGGLIRGLNLSGFDAAIRIVATEGAAGARALVTVEDTCIAHSGRGIASSHPALMLVAKNVLIEDVLGNGISFSPSALGTPLDSILVSFNLTVLNPGQACVFVKNSEYRAFQTHLVDCGFNGPLIGAGGGLIAVDSEVSFTESSVNAPNGPGIAARGGDTFVKDSEVFLAYGIGILLFEPDGWGAIEGSHVRLTQPFPSGHPQAGRFGDGVSAVGQGAVWLDDTSIEDSARAGLSNFGSVVSLGDTTIECAVWDLEGEPYLDHNFWFGDRGGNVCGCPTANRTCLAVSASLEPPGPATHHE